MTDTTNLQSQPSVDSMNNAAASTIKRAMEFADDPYNMTMVRLRTCISSFSNAEFNGDKFAQVFALNNLVQDASIMMMHLLEEIRKEEENEAVS